MCLFSGNVCPQHELHNVCAAEALSLLQLPGTDGGVIFALLCLISGGRTAPCPLLLYGNANFGFQPRCQDGIQPFLSKR